MICFIHVQLFTTLFPILLCALELSRLHIGMIPKGLFYYELSIYLSRFLLQSHRTLKILRNARYLILESGHKTFFVTEIIRKLMEIDLSKEQLHTSRTCRGNPYKSFMDVNGELSAGFDLLCAKIMRKNCDVKVKGRRMCEILQQD